jgi:hypothetical protein
MAIDTRNTSNDLRANDDTRRTVVTLLTVIGILLLGFVLYKIVDPRSEFGNEPYTTMGTTTNNTGAAGDTR